MRRSRSFSLLEIVIVLLLISTIAGVSSCLLIPFYRSYQFQAEVEAVYALAGELQIEALTLQSDMQLLVKQEKGQWVVRSHSEEVALKPQRIELSHVETVAGGEESIVFYANGQIEPKKVLTFQRGVERRGVDFRRPLLIKLWREDGTQKRGV